MIGDYNLTFCDNYYYTKFGRESVMKCFEDSHVSILTKDRPECIDHIAISDGFIAGHDVNIDEWNYEKTLSDHKGIVVKI